MPTQEISKKVRLSLDVSPSLNHTIEELARESGATKSDILRRAITLMEIAIKAQERGDKIAVIDKDQPAKTEIVGL